MCRWMTKANSQSTPHDKLSTMTFKTQINDTLKTLSWHTRPTKLQVFNSTGEDGTTKEKSIQDIINDLNAPLQNDDGSYNPNSLKFRYNGLHRDGGTHQARVTAANGVELSVRMMRLF